MKGLLAAIAAVMGAMRKVWEYCAKTGRMVAKVVIAPLAGGGAPAAMADDEPPEAAVAAVEQDLVNIRRLAGAMAADRVTGEDLAPVADNRIEWLMAMDRSMLAKVLCADDAALKAHLRGQRGIRGVLAADAESVAAYRDRMSVNVTYEPEMAPALAYAA